MIYYLYIIKFKKGEKMEAIIWIMIIMLAISGVLFAIYFNIENKQFEKLEQLQRYWDIELGMPEEKMLNIMGEGYSRSLLKNNRVKYEWRINAYSYGSYHGSISTRIYSGIKKVTIYTQNGLVEEVRPHNV